MRVPTYLVLLLSLSLSHAQTLIIGADEFKPPFVMASGYEKQFTGFDATLMSEICKRMKANCIFKGLLFGDIFKAINNGSINLAIGGITISLNRDKAYNFSLPYLQSYAQYVVSTNSPINSTNALSDKTFGTPADSVFITMLQDNYGNNVRIKTYVGFPQMNEALSTGAIDVLVLDYASANYWISNTCPECRLLGDKIPYGYGYGILAAKNQDALISSINKALLSIQSDGTYLKIYSIYF